MTQYEDGIYHFDGKIHERPGEWRIYDGAVEVRNGIAELMRSKRIYAIEDFRGTLTHLVPQSQAGTWQPVEDGKYSSGDTTEIRVHLDGRMIEIFNSASGAIAGAIFDDRHEFRLCRYQPAVQPLPDLGATLTTQIMVPISSSTLGAIAAYLDSPTPATRAIVEMWLERTSEHVAGQQQPAAQGMPDDVREAIEELIFLANDSVDWESASADVFWDARNKVEKWLAAQGEEAT